jgi:hypothetical protein
MALAAITVSAFRKAHPGHNSGRLTIDMIGKTIAAKP